MPVSGEAGVDLHGRLSANSFIGLPIKKRKYHIVRSPSPPRISSSLPKEPNLSQNDEPISNIDTPISGIGVDCKGVNERISTDRNVNLSNEISVGPNLQHSDDTCTFNSELRCKGKLIPNDESTSQQVAIDSGLLFSYKEPFQQFIGKEISEEKPILSTKYVSGGVLGNTELLSALKEPHGLPTECQNIGESYPKQEKWCQSPAECHFDFHSGNPRDLTLFEGKGDVQTKGNLIVSNVDCTHLHEIRSHWDLNTTMDAWKGSYSSSNISVNYAADVTTRLDIKPEVRSKELVLRNLEDNQATSTRCANVESKQSFDLQSCLNSEPCPPTKLIRVKAESDQGKLEKPMPVGSMKIVLHQPVKSEPFELGDQGNFRTVQNQSQLIHLRTPKPEVCDVISQEGLRTVYSNKLVNPSGVKSESLEESNQVGIEGEGRSHCPEIHKLTPEPPISGDIAQGVAETVEALDLVPGSAVPHATKAVVADCVLDSAQMTDSSVAYTNCSASIPTDEPRLDSSAIIDAAESGDDGKINVSAVIHEDDSFDSGLEMDGTSNVDVVVGQTTNNDNGGNFEDWEVREPLVHDTSVEGVCKEGKTERVSSGELGSKEVDVSVDPGGDGVIISSHIDSKDCTTENPRETLNARRTGGHISTLSVENKKGNSSFVPRLKKCSASAVSAAGSGKRRFIKVMPHDFSGKKEHGLKGLETNSNQVASSGTSHERVTDDGKEKTVYKEDTVEGLDDLGKASSKISKSDTSVRDDEGTRINHSRIINLAQTTNGPSPGRPRSIPGPPMALRTERGRFPHASFRVGQLHFQGSRDESCMGGQRKFERDRNIDQLTGKSGPSFMHMEGQVDNSLDARRESDYEFSSRHYDSSTGARFPKAKNIAAVDAAEVEGNGLFRAPDGRVVNLGTGRAWRRPMHEKLERFCPPPFRRGSPAGRERPMPLSPQMVRRRVISPGSCISRGDPEMVLVRHNEKLMRDLPEEMMDPLLPHSRSQYQRVHNPIIRRERSFSPVEMRGPVRLPPICSKSPPRSGSYSPDQFGEHPKLFPCGSPPAFRVERMRSPPHFTPTMERRHGSPPHMIQLADEMRKRGPLREHDCLRPFILNRSPSGRSLQRSTRGFDMIDSRERMEGDEYFGPLYSGQFHELVVDGCVNDRRECLERCRPIRSFRPNDVSVERFCRPDNGSRPYRFFPGANAEFNEKRLRDSPREFEVCVKNQLGSRRQPRSVDEHGDEQSFHGQEWTEASLNGTVGLKRGRF
eukprot:TRINITY_DN2125_c0_g2_i1.p1 TRINITY_DN2125_c0_g2~~TRINITY_DN2125_c0_g2_i1.p1  ORF type:complete len:1253 (+),score=258.95 TRINITY_DN2125_c0_g2_i1:257-4015(+)